MDSIATARLLRTPAVESIRSQVRRQVASDVSNNTRPATGGFSGFVEAMATELLPISVSSNRSDG